MDLELRRIAKVSILDCPYSVDREFDYEIPLPLKASVLPGVFVLVPFGSGNKRMIGLVHSVAECTVKFKTKPILEVVSSMPALSDESLKMCEFVSDRCFCTVGTALKAVMPSSVMPNAELKYVIVSKDSVKVDGLNEKSKALLAFIASGKDVTDAKLVSEFGEEATDAAKALIKLGICEKVSVSGKSGDKLEKYIRLSDEYSGCSEEEFSSLSPKQSLLAGCLSEYGELSQNDVLARLPITSSVISSMEKKGIVTVQKRAVMRNPFSELYEESKNPKSVELSEAQKKAFDKIAELYDSHEAKAALLFGITGSGKTMVMKKLIDHVIADGRKVIMLLPEIALTPQAVKIFISFYGKRVAVFHSALSIGERHDAWKAVEDGKIDLVIGTRSAIFTPIENLGLIIIDEEQESSYKSDIAPKYHAKDIARFRCAYNKATLVLASATPSVESYYKAEKGDYTLVKLTERYGSAVLPDTMIADMRYFGHDGSEFISRQLLSELSARIERREKSVLFLNRRGYHVYMSCRKCGETVMCPNCSVSLTLHRKRYGGGYSDKLMCHYCGYTVSPPKLCPTCSSDALKYFGLGTQKIEDEIANVLPEAVTVRMDADTTVGKMSHKKIIDEFAKDETDILVGTQMVTKGHDFKDVTLVGIISADMSLHSDDFRANERTFSLITQCAGRAGRAGKKGLAIIQTFSPEHPVIKFAARQDYESFYKNEIAIRKEMIFPPFCDFAVFNLHSPVERELLCAATELRKLFDTVKSDGFSDVGVIIFGPFEAGIYKLNNSFRVKIAVKCKNNKLTREYFSEILHRFLKNAPKTVNVGIDINPSNI